MNNKPVVQRARAGQDVDEAVDYYLREAGEKTALEFVDALEQAYRQIARFPATGSLRYAFELDLPDLRSWSLRRFPYRVFYVERHDHIDVWRVLHGVRDIPAWLNAPESG